MPSAVWSSPVRYAEADQQGVVFNAHYLTYADEAMGAFCTGLGLLELVQNVQLVASSLSWTSPARWGDVVDVDAQCTRVGTSSLRMRFVIRVGERTCCTVETTYVHAPDGRAAPVPADARAALA